MYRHFMEEPESPETSPKGRVIMAMTMSNSASFSRLKDDPSGLSSLQGINEVSLATLRLSSSSSSESESDFFDLDDTLRENNVEDKLNALLSTSALKCQTIAQRAKNVEHEFRLYYDQSVKFRAAAKAEKTRMLDARLEELKAEDLATAAELEAVEKELNEITLRKTASWRQVRSDLGIATNQLVKAEKRLEERRKVSTAQKRFLQKAGISFGFSDDGIHKSVGFTDIVGNENSNLYFSLLQLPAFKVYQAVPHFKEFDELAAEVNESQDFIKLLNKTHEYFTRDGQIKAKDLEEFASPPIPYLAQSKLLRQ